MAGYVYPHYPKQLLCENGVSYGIGDHYDTFPDRNIAPYNFSSVLDIDLSNFDITVHDSASNQYRMKLFEMKNGYTLWLSMWWDNSIVGIQIASYWLDENGNNVSMPGIADTYSTALAYAGNNRSRFSLESCKLYILAEYPTNTIVEVSECTYFGIAIMFKTYLTKYIGLDMVTLENDINVVSENNQTQWQYINNVSYGGELHLVQPATFGVATINFDDFKTYVKSHGRTFEGDIYSDEDPYDPPAGSTDTSTPGGGHGNYDNTSDPVDFPTLPNGGALESGAVNAYLISKQSLQTIMGKLWSNSIFDILTMWQKSITDPMDAIVSLHAIPVTPSITTANNVIIGNFDTEVPTPTITSQYVEVDCGTLNISEYWGSALDYSPYTKAEIYLPFVGVKDVAIEDVMNATIHIKYHIDILTGDCIAFIKCGLSVLYHFTGNCRMTIPLSSKTTDALQNTIGETGKLLTGAAMMGATGGAALAAGMTISSAANVASSKIRTGRTGDISGSASLMDSFTPYVIIHRPVQSLAKDYNKFKGYPSNITRKLSTLSGYTEVEHIHLQGIPNATDEEMNEIVRLLKQGIII